MRDWHVQFFKLWEKVQFDIYTPEQDKIQTNFIVKALKLKKGMSVLDVPCGYGRISHLLAQRGIDVTGIEYNENVLDYAIKKAKAEGVKLKCIHGDMREINYRNRFDAVLCWFGSFGYFSDEDNEKFIKRASRSLKKGGKFLIDTHTLETLITIYEPVTKGRYGKVSMTEERELDFETSRINVKWTIGKKSQKSSIRLYGYKELRDLLTKHGFGNFNALGSINGEKYEFGARRLILICEKL